MNTLITIGRQFGSGGREIGEKVAAHYGIPYYDKELITKAAANSEFCKEMIQQHDEAPTNSFLYNLVMDTYSFGYNASNFVDMPISQKVFLAQFDTIKQLAKEGPVVFIGRCADSALQDFPNVINLFIYADDSYRIHEIMHRYPDITTEQKARDFMNKKDRQRQSYYNYYSSKKWGAANTYDACLSTSLLGMDGTAELIIQLIDDFEKKRSLK
ncbi:MAG: cytidylate kinase-like family protein [Lachnospiraceae bacterium]|jgi:cytidylate kinase|nr:cytidylate kinase-like family protein [Lachnospiraceae bacterium]